ncbi:MAG: hypothetical protein COA67_06705 [Lutibacter sp.]|nr:MAG: hypothetical protein COA67_06705 [Lutibacter sp.]
MYKSRSEIKLNDIITTNIFTINKQNLFVWLNAVFLIGLLIFDKTDALTIVIAYFLETIIIGIVHAFKMFTIISSNPSSKESYSTILFFLVHYLFFVAIQLIFVFSFLEMNDSNITSGFNLIHNISYVMSLKGMIIVLISILIYNLADYYLNFIQTQVYKKARVREIFSQPYVRIIIQQFAVILGGFFIIFSSGVFIVAILLILIRTLIELLFISNPLLFELKNPQA